MASLVSTDFHLTEKGPVVLVTQNKTNILIINIFILLLGPTIIICTHLFLKKTPQNKQAKKIPKIKWTAWYYRLMLSHHNMDPAASLSHGLMTHHFWLWGQRARSERPHVMQH